MSETFEAWEGLARGSAAYEQLKQQRAGMLWDLAEKVRDQLATVCQVKCCSMTTAFEVACLVVHHFLKQATKHAGLPSSASLAISTNDVPITLQGTSLD